MRSLESVLIFTKPSSSLFKDPVEAPRVLYMTDAAIKNITFFIILLHFQDIESTKSLSTLVPDKKILIDKENVV